MGTEDLHTANEGSSVQGWEGDALQRQSNSDFLYKFVLKKCQAKQGDAGSGALCFALDGDWGVGKTFFVDRWIGDLQRYGHPVIKFDAWKNDLTDDPLVGFMAHLKDALGPYIETLPVKQQIKNAANRKVKSVVKSAGKALLPALGILAKGVVGKVTGANMNELAELFQGEEPVDATQDSKDEDAGEPAPKLAAIAKPALDKFFEIALKSYTDRQGAIQSLKETIESLLEYLSMNAGAQMPMFVFVDELDRCRPDYAIRLLEGLKHLFDAKGVCFVVSTNLTQLSESVRSVYGSGFNGYMYLKRFFAFEYVLPVANHNSYAQSLFKHSIFDVVNSIYATGLPEPRQTETRRAYETFAVIADAFSMDLRSQQQVFKHAEAAASGVPSGETIHLFYLFFLTALVHYSRSAFDQLAANGKGVDVATHRALYQGKDAHFADCEIIYHVRDRQTGRQVEKRVAASQLFYMYEEVSHKKLLAVYEREQQRSQDPIYPDTIYMNVVGNLNLIPSQTSPTSIAKYRDLVRSAGCIV